jgi:hypothetical protein
LHCGKQVRKDRREIYCRKLLYIALFSSIL